MGDLMAFWALLMAIVTLALCAFNRVGYDFKLVDIVFLCLACSVVLLACYGIGYFIGTVF